MPWVVAGASTTGPAHRHADLPCADAHACLTLGDLAILVVCDGAGSASHGCEGALLVAAELSRQAESWYRAITPDATAPNEAAPNAAAPNAAAPNAAAPNAAAPNAAAPNAAAPNAAAPNAAAPNAAAPNAAAPNEAALATLTDETLGSWFLAARTALAGQAEVAATAIGRYHCTAILVLASPTATVAAHIGDGVAITFHQNHQPESWRVLSWPDQGQFVGETVFVDDADLGRDLRISRTGGTKAVVAASDGFDPFVVQHAQRRVLPHQVEPLRQALAGGDPTTCWDEPLAQFIGHEAFDAHADDDRTLVIAVWRE